VPTHVGVAPVIPALSDQYMEAILEHAAGLGVKTASCILVRLPHEVSPLFREWLETHFPDRAGKVMAMIRDMRGGRDNDPGFFTRNKLRGAYGKLMRARFDLACRRWKLNERRYDLACSKFRPPAADGQLSLL
jgi:DNA repair photolyase